MIFGIVLFSVILFAGFTISSYADYTSPKKQIESGIAINDIQCRDDRVLVQRSNGGIACVSERTAERTGWEIIKTEFIHTEKLVTIPEPTITPELVTIPETTISPKQVTPTIVILDQSSDVEFVDDGREIWKAYAGGMAPPTNVYSKILSKLSQHSEFQNDGEGNITLIAVPHEKYSVDEEDGFYLEDWIPEYIPEGYKLFYSTTGYSSLVDTYYLTHQYVPTTFVLTEDTTTSDLKMSKGFKITVKKYPDVQSPIDGAIETYWKNVSQFYDNFGGFQDIKRDGKTVYAYSGGNSHLYYHATLSWQPDDHIKINVQSNYHSIEELLPIFNSIMK